ncbi:iron reductase [Stereum hirsutum FP-91666 SS1]|uniref:iron reductase n=1 Tax=Stereum hirsutum (strain FP-91666) TaxID=721885 RepID=UPI00044497E8|nr:iron reductase [Stereum hirsutum FP-91666 SS1]EIM82002.1 iron reductase [Stereum hirsutum FP-91666 SS1]
MFTWTLINSGDIDGTKLDPQYWGNRAGILATLQTPLIVALAMKNNIISLITGVGFDKLNYLHRMTARVVCIILFIHMGGRVQIGLSGNNTITLEHKWMICGIFGLSAFALLCIVSVRPARQLNYEVFIVLHFVLILVFLLGSYFHTAAKGYDQFMWPSFLLWGLDRLIRAIRVVVFNHSYFGFKSGLGTFNAKAEVAAPGFVRLTLRRPNHFGWSAGQSAFITMPGASLLPFESHPFTISNADVNYAKSTPTSSVDEKGDMVEAAEGHGKDVVFLINARQGFTKRLLDLAEKGGSLKVFLDGPYGVPPRVDGHDTVVFIAGGSGVTFTNPLFVDLVHRVRKNPSACSRVVFIWAIRHPDHMNLIYSDLQQALLEIPTSLHVEVRVFVTSPHVDSSSLSRNTQPRDSETSSTASVTHEGDEKAVWKLQHMPHTTVTSGRPDVEALLTEAASLTMGGSMSVNVCGPSGLTDRVRRHLRSSEAGPMAVLRGGPSINLFVEAFGMA